MSNIVELKQKIGYEDMSPACRFLIDAAIDIHNKGYSPTVISFSWSSGMGSGRGRSFGNDKPEVAELEQFIGLLSAELHKAQVQLVIRENEEMRS